MKRYIFFTVMALLLQACSSDEVTPRHETASPDYPLYYDY